LELGKAGSISKRFLCILGMSSTLTYERKKFANKKPTGQSVRITHVSPEIPGRPIQKNGAIGERYLGPKQQSA
jgi:hypothetical protein